MARRRYRYLRRHHHRRYHRYYKPVHTPQLTYRPSAPYHPSAHYNAPRRITLVKIVLALLVVFVLYLLLFNPPLPKGLLPILSPIIYIAEFLILVLGLMITTNISRHGTGGSLAMIVLGAFLIFLGLAWWAASGFSPPAYYAYEIWFGIVLGLIGLFTATYAALFGQSIIHIRY